MKSHQQPMEILIKKRDDIGKYEDNVFCCSGRRHRLPPGCIECMIQNITDCLVQLNRSVIIFECWARD